MFEMVTGQKNVVETLISDLKKGTLSNSSLFYGSRSTGKLTIALELARLLNCCDDGFAECSCYNCRSINNLDFPGLIFLSRRDFLPLLNSYYMSYQQSEDEAYVKKIIKVIKLIFQTVDEMLIKDAFSETDKKTILSALNKLSEIIDNGNIIEDFKSIIKSVESIKNLYKKMNIPVNSFRSVLDWSYIRQPGINRVVVIDHVDHLDESSANILLKRLEEPSAGLFFILLAENRNKIIQTILSRCRSYYFVSGSQSEVSEVIKRNFGSDELFNTVDHFINRDNPYYHAVIMSDAVKFVNTVFNPVHTLNELSDLIKNFGEKQLALAILNAVSHILYNEILKRESGEEQQIKVLMNVPIIDLRILNERIIEQINRIAQFSNNPVLALEGLFYPYKAERRYGQ